MNTNMKEFRPGNRQQTEMRSLGAFLVFVLFVNSVGATVQDELVADSFQYDHERDQDPVGSFVLRLRNSTHNFTVLISPNESVEETTTEILEIMGYEGRRDAYEYLKTFVGERLLVLEEKRGKFGAEDLSGTDPLFSINISPSRKIDQVQPLHFYPSDSIDYAYRRFFHQQTNASTTNKNSRTAILKTLHRKLVHHNKLYCDKTNRGGSVSVRECYVSQCKKQLPHFTGYENSRPMKPLKKVALLNSLGFQHGLGTCVETGTFQGDTTLALANSNIFELVVTIEFSKEISRNATDRFLAEVRKGNLNAARITQFVGDSGTVLQHHSFFREDQDRFKRTLWFLDGHYSAGNTARGDEDSPVMAEINHILAPHRNSEVDIVVIDDARQFTGGRLSSGANEIYPELHDVLKRVCELQPAAFVDLQNDLLIIENEREELVVV
jgi:hypothetical protein